MLDLGLGRFVEVHFDQSAATQANSGSLSHNLGRIDQVLENGIVDSSQSAARDRFKPEVRGGQTWS